MIGGSVPRLEDGEPLSSSDASCRRESVVEVIISTARLSPPIAHCLLALSPSAILASPALHRPRSVLFQGLRYISTFEQPPPVLFSAETPNLVSRIPCPTTVTSYTMAITTVAAAATMSRNNLRSSTRKVGIMWSPAVRLASELISVHSSQVSRSTPVNLV